MSCLGDRLTALVDGELDHDGRDLALSHLAGCDGCRAEAEALRRLKRRLSSLEEAPQIGTDLLVRLYGMGVMDTPPPPPQPSQTLWPPRTDPAVPGPSDELLRRLYRLDEQAVGEEPAGYRRPRDNRPGRGHRPASHRRRLPRARYLVAGAATLAALGAGSTPYVHTATARVPAKVSPTLTQVSVSPGSVSQARLPRRQDERKR